jgi:REP element-mobilizing transposase RayT
MATTYSKLLYHIIFSTKNREPLISPGLRDDLYAYIGGIVRARKSVLLEIGGMPDHVHLVIRSRPDLSVAELVRLVKANSSKWVNERPDSIGRFAWQDGYGAFSVSLSQLPGVRDYVRRQAEHHRGRTFQEEYEEFLKRNERSNSTSPTSGLDVRGGWPCRPLRDRRC